MLHIYLKWKAQKIYGVRVFHTILFWSKYVRWVSLGSMFKICNHIVDVAHGGIAEPADRFGIPAVPINRIIYIGENAQPTNRERRDTSPTKCKPADAVRTIILQEGALVVATEVFEQKMPRAWKHWTVKNLISRSFLYCCDIGTRFSKKRSVGY